MELVEVLVLLFSQVAGIRKPTAEQTCILLNMASLHNIIGDEIR